MSGKVRMVSQNSAKKKLPNRGRLKRVHVDFIVYRIPEGFSLQDTPGIWKQVSLHALKPREFPEYPPSVSCGDSLVVKSTPGREDIHIYTIETYFHIQCLIAILRLQNKMLVGSEVPPLSQASGVGSS